MSDSPRDKATNSTQGSNSTKQRSKAFVFLGIRDVVVRNDHPTCKCDYHLHCRRHKREGAIKEKARDDLSEEQEQETFVGGPTAV